MFTPSNNRHRCRALINYSIMKTLTAYEKNTNKIDNRLASGFYGSSVDAYLHIKNMEALKQPMKGKLLNYLITEQCDEELEMFLGRDHSTKNLFK